MEGSIVQAAALLGAGIAACGGIGAGLGQGLATASAIEAVARQPEAKTDIMSTLFVGCAITESTGIFALLVALILALIKS